jgi:pyridoxine kinase
MVQTPYVELQPLPNGMGDVFSSVLLGHLLGGVSTPEAVANAVSTLYALVARTTPGSRDLPLIAARDQIMSPSEHFEAIRLTT